MRPEDTVTYVLTAHVLGAHYTAAGTQRRPEDTVACVFIAHAVRVLPRTYASEGRMHMRPGGHGRVRPRCTRPRGASHGRRSARARGRVRPEDVFVPRTRPSKGRAQPLRTSSSRTSSGRYNARSEDGCAEDERVPRTGESRIQWIGSDPTRTGRPPPGPPPVVGRLPPGAKRPIPCRAPSRSSRFDDRGDAARAARGRRPTRSSEAGIARRSRAPRREDVYRDDARREDACHDDGSREGARHDGVRPRRDDARRRRFDSIAFIRLNRFNCVESI